MFTHPKTFTDYILEQAKTQQHTDGFIILLTQLQDAIKLIASHVRKAGLADILGKTDTKNASDDEVQKLDAYANEVLVKTLLESGQVHAIGSEELDEPLYAKGKGEYIVLFDPLDGSSNIDSNGPIGSIFSIYKGTSLLQKGSQQIAAFYVVYGSSTVLMFATPQGVCEFTLDTDIGSFLLSRLNVQIPKKGTIYEMNEGNTKYYDDATKKYLSFIKDSGVYKGRYSGAMVADIHRIITKGGIFLYPQDKKNTQGRVRLLYEVNPMSFIIEKAGGLCISNDTNPLDIIPKDIHQKAGIVLGSKENVKEYLKIVYE